MAKRASIGEIKTNLDSLHQKLKDLKTHLADNPGSIPPDLNLKLQAIADHSTQAPFCEDHEIENLQLKP